MHSEKSSGAVKSVLTNDSVSGAAGWSLLLDEEGGVVSVKRSPEQSRMTGLSDAATTQGGDAFLKLIHPEDRAAAIAALDAVLKDRTNRTVFDEEYRLLLADGRWHWVRDMGRVAVDSDGRRRFFGMMVTIDDYKAEQAEAREKEDVLARLCREQAEQLARIRDLNDALEASRAEAERQMEVATGLSSEYSSVWLVTVPEMSIALMKNFGSPVIQRVIADALKTPDYDAAITKYVMHYVVPEDQERLLKVFAYENIRRELEKKRYFRVGYRRQIGGQLQFFEATLARVGRDEASQNFILAFRNVDGLVCAERQKQAALETSLEAAQRANRAKTVFLNSISHDIRTPMNGIIGMTAIAAAHIDDKDRVKDCLGKISVASSHLLGLINDVLDIARIESGKTTLVEENFSLPQLFSELLTIVGPAADAKEQKLVVDIDDVTHEFVVGDSLRLRQVFINVIGNAVKFTPSSGAIRVALREKPTSSRHYATYELVCSDTGCGMKPEFIEKIFVPFSRADNVVAENVPGTGLGLSIARNIIGMMDGDIKVESVYGEGSVFTVTFRLKTRDEVIGRDPVLQGLSALVVDDDEGVCESTVHALSELGMTSEAVMTGEAAVEKVAAAHEAARDYNVCLIDWKLPGMDGIETTRAVRACVGPDVPIIIISAYDWFSIEKEAREAGADGFIEKPLFKSRLDVVLSSLVQGKSDKAAAVEFEDLEKLDFSGRRVLLVEDNPLNQEIATEMLKMTKVEIETAANGQEAVTAFETHRPGWYDLILMDIQMPVLDGNAAARRIRASTQADACTVPVVAMSANAFAEDRSSARKAGMNDYLTKPVHYGELVRMMSRYLG